MVLLGAVILPHGTMPYDGDPQSPSSAVRERQARLDPAFRNTLTQLFQGICKASSDIASLQADLYIIHTPHGICLSESYGVYNNRVASGSAKWLNEWSEFTATGSLDRALARPLKNLFVQSGTNAQLVTCYGGSDEVKMCWGEAVPMWYLKKYQTNDPKYMIIGEDTIPGTGSIEDWRLQIGKQLADFVESLPLKVVIVISGDLSHCHPTDCTNPLYLPDPGDVLPVNKEASEACDAAIANWIQAGTPSSWDPSAALPFLTNAVALDPDALACGMNGFVVLHGFLDSYIQQGASFSTNLAVRSAPTYYGMLAATFIKN